MTDIPLAKFKADCAAIIERVAATGEAVTITHRGKALVQIAAARPQDADQSGLTAAAPTLDLDEDVIDDDELLDMEATNQQWDALNRAISRDVAGTKAKAPRPRSAPRKPAAKAIAKAKSGKLAKDSKPR